MSRLGNAANLESDGNKDDAITLLKLTNQGLPGSIPALNGVASRALHIVDEASKFTSSRQEWTKFGRSVRTATITFIQSLGTQNYPDVSEAREQTHYFLE
ncbi:hypothetical protein HWV62_29278 [Athelia sp. TMB]|nr:hypothetical protein HWV62_29278 [Athelia sp. TMB]